MPFEMDPIRETVSAMTFTLYEISPMLVMNCPIKLRCPNWGGQHMSDFCCNAKVIDLWSVKMAKYRPSTMCRTNFPAL